MSHSVLPEFPCGVELPSTTVTLAWEPTLFLSPFPFPYQSWDHLESLSSGLLLENPNEGSCLHEVRGGMKLNAYMIIYLNCTQERILRLHWDWQVQLSSLRNKIKPLIWEQVTKITDSKKDWGYLGWCCWASWASGLELKSCMTESCSLKMYHSLPWIWGF